MSVFPLVRAVWEDNHFMMMHPRHDSYTGDKALL
jgi:hypothetical protein